jgi:hypothetical protein
MNHPFSRYKKDAFGRPRPLSSLENLLHAIAWPVVIGVTIGYALAIALVALQDASAHGSQATKSPSRVEAKETVS